MRPRRPPDLAKMTNTQRRSRRSNEVIAPGFGTRQDLERLARDLSSDSVFPVAAVQAMMESRGRGIRSSRRSGDAAAAASAPVTSTPVSSAWADFMKEEGVNDASQGTDSKRSAADSDEANPASSTTGNRTYTLALGKDKKKKKSCGLLVQAGTLEWTVVGRTKNFNWDAAYTLTAPTILSGLRVHSVFTAGHACHSLAIAENGKVYGWGRNESNNLTSSLGKNVWAPTELPGIPSGNVLSASVGKSHTLVLVDKEGIYAVGSNKVGQCGVNKGTEQVANFRKSNFADGLDPEIVKVRASIPTARYVSLSTCRYHVEKTFRSPCVQKGTSILLDRRNTGSWAMAKLANTSSRPTSWRSQMVTHSPSVPNTTMHPEKSSIRTTRKRRRRPMQKTLGSGT